MMMKYAKHACFILLIIAFSFQGFSQIVDRNQFNQSDSIWKVATKTEVIGLSASGDKLKTEVVYFDLQRERYRFINHTHTTVYFIFPITAATTTEENNTKIRVTFEGGETKTYANKGSDRNYSAGDFSALYFEIDPASSDPLTRKRITAVRIMTTGLDYDFEVKNNGGLIKDMLVVLAEEIKRGRKAD